MDDDDDDDGDDDDDDDIIYLNMSCWMILVYWCIGIDIIIRQHPRFLRMLSSKNNDLVLPTSFLLNTSRSLSYHYYIILNCTIVLTLL